MASLVHLILLGKAWPLLAPFYSRPRERDKNKNRHGTRHREERRIFKKWLHLFIRGRGMYGGQSTARWIGSLLRMSLG